MAEFKVFGEQDNNETREPERKTGNKVFNKVKKLFKKKPFLIAVAVVVVLGLLAWYKKSQVPATAEDETESEMVLADGLELMYPANDTFVGSGGSYFEDVLDTMVDSFNEELTNMDNYYQSEITYVKDVLDITVDDMSGQIESLSNQIDTQSDTLAQQTDYIARQNDIQMMQQNSDAWHYATSDADKKALEKTNKAIAEKYGWELGDDGIWYDEDEKPVYTTVTQKVATSSSTPKKSLSSSSSTKTTSTTSDIDKMKANSTAWHTASDSQKQKLHEENVAIAKKNNWTFDSGSGTYKDSAGNRVY